MDQQRWERIDLFLQAALEVAPEARAAFLDEACAGDAELRREVDELLSREVDTGKLLRHAPQFLHAGQAASQAQASLTGRRIGRYRIAACIGRGGMGEVYRAEDVELEREAALKTLPAEFTAQPERVRRFMQEAIAASRLNHPNILTVYEIVHAEDAHFIATEFVEGQTLRQLLTDPATNQPQRLSLERALDIAIQTASALKAAHAAGIIHRDIKPENVMVRTDGLVKVLDFGIAKLGLGDEGTGRRGDGGMAKQEDGERELSSSPRPPVSPSPRPLFIPSLTLTGTILGTARYMSPEQADAQEVDHRTDLFSLGVVLYEMIAGQAPFAGENKTEILAAVRQSHPPLLPKAPKPLQRVVSRALHCEREHRWQTADELLSELKSLQQTLERRARPGQVARRVALFALLASLIVASVVWSLSKFRSFRSSHLPAPNITRLISNGSVRGVAISPDGRYVAYTMGRATTNSLWLREVETGNDRELLPPAARLEYQLLSFSPADDGVYYVAYDPHRDVKALHRIPLRGGAPNRVLEAIDSPAAFSPDGRQLAFVRYDGARQQSALMVANADGSAERTLVTRREPFKFSTRRIAWSPDGQGIAYATGTTGKERDHRVYEYSFQDGSERLLSKQPWRVIEGVAWLGDRRSLALLASDPGNNQESLWHLSLTTDERRRLSVGLERKNDLSVTADGSTMITVEMEELQSLWVASATNLGQTRQLLLGKEVGRGGLAWTPEGQILYVSTASGKHSLWAINADGRENRRFSFGNDTSPAVSPDGRFVVFCSTTGGDHIWRMDRDGGNRQQLTFGADSGSMDVEPRCSPDGQWVIYVSWSESRQATLWRVPMAGGPAERLTDVTTANPSPAISPNGRWLAYYQRSPQENQRKRIFIIPLEPASGGAPDRILDVPHSAYLLQWSPDGQALDYAEVREDVGNLWRLPLNGDAPRQLTDFKADAISRFAWSRDGSQLIVSRSIYNLDVILLRDFQ